MGCLLAVSTLLIGVAEQPVEPAQAAASANIYPSADGSVGNFTNFNGTKNINLFGSLRKSPSNPDDTSFIRTEFDDTAFFELDNPGPAVDRINEVSFTVRQRREGGALSTTSTVYYQIFTADEVTPMTAESAGQLTTAAFANLSFTLRANAVYSHEAWRAAKLRVRHDNANVSVSDNSIVNISAVEGQFQHEAYDNIRQADAIFEANDGADPDGNTYLGQSGVRDIARGDEVTARILLEKSNSSTAYPAATQLGLFYERGDNIWTKVNSPAPVSLGSTCAQAADYTCAVVTGTSTAEYSDVAFTTSGVPWIVYRDPNFGGVSVATYVGTGGTGCVVTSWTCMLVHDGAFGEPAIAIGPDGAVWVTFEDDLGGAVGGAVVGRYVGSGGIGCSTTAWTCEQVETSDFSGTDPSIVIQSNGVPAVSYRVPTDKDLRFATRVGSGGAGCTSSAWTCTTIDSTNDVGNDSSITLDRNGVVSIVYGDDTNFTIRLARQVSGTGCAVTSWSCVTVGGPARDSFSIVYDNANMAWIGAVDITNDRLTVARQVLAGTGTGCSNTNFTCVQPLSGTGAANKAKIALDPAGQPWVFAVGTAGGNAVRLFRYAGHKGSGCSISTWTCTTLATNVSIDTGVSGGFDADGNPRVTYPATGDTLGVMRLHRGGELSAPLSTPQGASGQNVTKSHSDMFSEADLSNRVDADCPASSLYVNGKYTTTGEAASYWTAGSTSNSCAEYAFVFSTRSAKDRSTYRLMVATKNAARPDKGIWRELSAYATYPSFGVNTGINQSGFIFEKNDGVTPDSNSQLAEGNRSIAKVERGGAITARLQATNSGAALTTTPAGLFAERDGDGVPIRVGAPAPVAPLSPNNYCYDRRFSCGAVVGGTSKIGHSAGAFGTDGAFRIAYFVSGSVRLAHHVGSGGTGCTNAEWTCTTVDTANTYPSLAVGPNGALWMAYGSASGVRVAQFVGSGGTGCSSSTAWTCTTVSTEANYDARIGIDGNSNPFVTYESQSNGIRVARFVGSSGTGCAVASWHCATLAFYGFDAFNAVTGADGAPMVAFEEANFYRVARYVGAGGSGCDSPEWTCDLVSSGTLGTGSSGQLAVSATGRVVFTFARSGGTLHAAEYVGRGGEDCTSEAWSCRTIETNLSGERGQTMSSAFDVGGKLWVAYQVTGSNKTILGQESGGSSSNGSCIAAFACTDAFYAPSTAANSTLAFDHNGVPWYFSFDSTGLFVGRMMRGGELTIASSSSQGVDGTAVTQSHADMTSTGDTTNRSDADCLRPSTTWNDGRLVLSSTLSGLPLAAGNSTPQCTELNFVVDTSNAARGQYKLFPATYNAMGNGRSPFSRPISTTKAAKFALEPNLNNRSQDGYVFEHDDGTTPDNNTYLSAGNTPITIAPSTNGRATLRTHTTNRGPVTGPADVATFAARGNGIFTQVGATAPPTGAACTGDSTFTCETVSTGSAVSGGNSTAVHPSGTVYTAMKSGTTLLVAESVASGGTNCAVTSYTCTSIDTTSSVAAPAAMAIGSDGVMWIAYYDFISGDITNSRMRIARSVGSGGTGCALTSAWTCETLRLVADPSYQQLSITVDGANRPWVGYVSRNQGVVAAARYVGSGGTGCTSTAWTCEDIGVRGSSNIKFPLTIVAAGADDVWLGWWDPDGVQVAHYTGGSSSGCRTTAWSCETVQEGSTWNAAVAVTMSSAGRPAVAYMNGSNKLEIATYVGVNGTGCANDAWTCMVLTTPIAGEVMLSMAYDVNNALWITYAELASSVYRLRLARQVDGTGAGCSVTGWSCVTLDYPSRSVGQSSSLVFDSAGHPYVSYFDAGASRVRIAHYNGGGLSYHGASTQGATGAAVTTSHADVTASSDSTNRNDADCLVAGAVWNNGQFSKTRLLPNGSLPEGKTTPQCTEYSIALAGTAPVAGDYRLLTATKATHGFGRQDWFGPTTVAQYPVLTIPANSSPDAPTALVQQSVADVVLPTGGWSNQTTLRFAASGTDPNNPDQIALCVEVDPLGTAFSNNEDGCGSFSAVAGASTSVTVDLPTTVEGQFHWQARLKDSAGAYSSWVAYGGNAETARDFGIDLSGPTGGSVNDGTGSDVAYNNGSLATLSANWSSFDGNISGLLRYDYSIGTSPGGTDVLAWQTGDLSTSRTVNGLSLRTTQKYFFNVRAHDNAGNATVVSSNGQVVAPTLTFNVASPTVTLEQVATNDFSSSVSYSVQANAYNGYKVRLSTSDSLRSSDNATVGVFNGGTAAAPDSYGPSDLGFGYTSSDPTINGSTLFPTSGNCPGGSPWSNSNGCYAPVPVMPASEVVVDELSYTLNNHTLGLFVRTPPEQAAGRYRTTLLLTATANY